MTKQVPSSRAAPEGFLVRGQAVKVEGSGPEAGEELAVQTSTL